MTGSAPSPFGAYLTRLQRFTCVRPEALLPSHSTYAPLRAFDAPLRRRHLYPRPEPATRRTGMPTVAGLTPASLEQLLRTHHVESLAAAENLDGDHYRVMFEAEPPLEHLAA